MRAVQRDIAFRTTAFVFEQNSVPVDINFHTMTTAGRGVCCDLVYNDTRRSSSICVGLKEIPLLNPKHSYFPHRHYKRTAAINSNKKQRSNSPQSLLTFHAIKISRNSSVNIVTTLQAGRCGVRRQDRLWGPSCLLLVGYRRSFARGSLNKLEQCQLMNTWSNTSMSPSAFMSWYKKEDRGR